MMKRTIGALLALCMALALFPAALAAEDDPARVDALLEGMSLEDRIAQMIMPSLRVWDGEKATDLSACPALAEALRRHPYGGVILFGQNIADAGQTVRLIDDLQRNNAQGGGAVPYLIAADQEGGSVARLSMGTRGTGSMAIGATGQAAEANARAIGQVFGEELAALGINVNLGPCLDVISDPSDPGMSTRVFSDDAEVAARLGLAFAGGVGQSGVITCYKHFPGAGDGSDYPTAIRLTPDELEQSGLSAFRAAIDGGAEMVMMSATTFPLIDDEMTLADGETRGFWPATLSAKLVGLLRQGLGFDGVVITDALEMQQFVTEPDTGVALFTGDFATVEHDVQVARAAIDAGCDLLLMPTDLVDEAAAEYYEGYIAGIAALVAAGEIDGARIEASVRRILTLKARHGLLDLDDTPAEARVAAAEETVGAPEHHAVEAETARQAVTLLKDDGVLPLAGGNIVILGRTDADDTPIRHALDGLMQGGFIDLATRIDDRITGEITGEAEAGTAIVIDRYYADGESAYSDALAGAVRAADAVVCLDSVGAGLDRLQDDNPQVQAVARALADAHAGGGKFVLLSDNLPLDAARFTEADAIVCAYLSAGFAVDPAAPVGGSANPGAYNANVPAALRAIFGDGDMPGALPIDIPALRQDADGGWAWSDEILYPRGYSARAAVRTGIIGAMDEEVDSLKRAMTEETVTTLAGMEFHAGRLDGADVVVVKCSVGKVNAAACAQILIDRFGVDRIINTGVAGSLDAQIDIGDIVVSTDAVQHDMDAAPLGYVPGEIPYMEVWQFPADAQMRRQAVRAVEAAAPEARAFEGRVCSGDQFIASHQDKAAIAAQFGGLCCEMEGASIAQVCWLNGTPFVIIRAISDKADDSGEMAYNEFVHMAAERCAAITRYMISH